jgi:hypothetical protein
LSYNHGAHWSLAPAFFSGTLSNIICPLDTNRPALLSKKPPSSGTTPTSHGRSRMVPLPVLRRTVLGSKPQDRFLRVVSCGRIVHRGCLLLGTVSRSPHGTSVPNPRFQHPHFCNIASLEPSTCLSKNPAACHNMEDRVVLGGHVREDVRVQVQVQSRLRLFLPRPLGSICLQQCRSTHGSS